MTQLNTQQIQQNLADRHQKFNQEVGVLSGKLGADYHLQLTRMQTRLNRILECFIEVGVLDLSIPLSENAYKGFQIMKNGYDKQIYVWTNGNDIIVKDSSFMINSGIIDSKVEYIRNIVIDEYDWEDFANRLLDYIHVIIYQRKESYNYKIWGQ